MAPVRRVNDLADGRITLDGDRDIDQAAVHPGEARRTGAEACRMPKEPGAELGTGGRPARRGSMRCGGLGHELLELVNELAVALGPPLLAPAPARAVEDLGAGVGQVVLYAIYAQLHHRYPRCGRKLAVEDPRRPMGGEGEALPEHAERRPRIGSKAGQGVPPATEREEEAVIAGTHRGGHRYRVWPARAEHRRGAAAPVRQAHGRAPRRKRAASIPASKAGELSHS